METPEHSEQTNQFLTARNLLVRDLRRAGLTGPERTFFAESGEWARDMQKKYADTHLDTLSYHAMTGSTPGSACTREDFPGEDSALVLLQKVRDKYLTSHE